MWTASRSGVFRIGYFAFLVTFLGCAGEKPQVSKIPESSDPAAEITRLQTNLEEASQKQMDILAPQHFLKSKKAFSEAKELRAENQSNSDVLNKVAEGDAYLNRATELAAASEPALAEIITARSDAVAAQAPKYLKDDFRSADKKLIEITTAMEKNRIQLQPQDRGDLIKLYKGLELRGVEQASMGDSLRTVQEAKREGAEEWAPHVLARTERQASQLKSLIYGNPKAKENINLAANQLKQQADQLLGVTRQAKLVNARNPEDVALRMEEQKNQVAKLKTEGASQQEALERKNQQMATLQGESNLTAQFKEIRSKFSPQEADVFRTEHEIVIRLKGLHFPVSGTNIPSRDFATLNKLSDTLKEFPGSQVAIEGHTDSKGSRSANLKLSEKRAEAVKDYLVANQSVSEDKATVKGKGFSQPIASNRTKAGRSQNRRVDVMIETQA